MANVSSARGKCVEPPKELGPLYGPRAKAVPHVLVQQTSGDGALWLLVLPRLDLCVHQLEQRVLAHGVIQAAEEGVGPLHIGETGRGTRRTLQRPARRLAASVVKANRAHLVLPAERGRRGAGQHPWATPLDLGRMTALTNARPSTTDGVSPAAQQMRVRSLRNGLRGVRADVGVLVDELNYALGALSLPVEEGHAMVKVRLVHSSSHRPLRLPQRRTAVAAATIAATVAVAWTALGGDGADPVSRCTHAVTCCTN